MRVATAALLISGAAAIIIAAVDRERAVPEGTAVGHDASGDLVGVRMDGNAPGDVDLTAVSVSIHEGTAQVIFRSAGPAMQDDLWRSWVWRAWRDDETSPVLTVFIQGGIGETPSPEAIWACPGTAFCSEKAVGATFARSGNDAVLTIPRRTVAKLPARFNWAAGAYARPHRTADSRWEDDAPQNGLTSPSSSKYPFPRRADL